MDERENTGEPESDGFGEPDRPEEAARSGLWDEYAREHSIGVALGSLALGLVAGVLIGALLARD